MEQDQSNSQNKGPIDYGKFFEEQKTVPNISQPQAGEVAQEASAQKSNFFAKIKESWSFAEKKTKIELLVFAVSLILTITFFSLYFAGRSPKQIKLPEGGNVAPPAIDMNLPLPLNQ